MAKKKTEEAEPEAKEMTATLGAISFLEQPRIGIEVRFYCEADPEVIERMLEMKQYEIGVADFDRGTGKVKNFGEVVGVIKGLSIPDKADRPARFKMHFSETEAAVKLLRYARKCDPPSLLLTQRQTMIATDSPDDDDGQMDLGEE